MKSNRLGILLAVSMAVVMISGLAAAAAQATIPPGPLWLVGCHKVLVPKTGEFKNSTCTEAEAKGEFAKKLLANETRSIRSRSIGTFKLKGPTVIICKKVENRGVLLGGNPGTDDVEIKFQECFLEGHEKCLATGLKPIKSSVKGEVPLEAYTVLTYADPETKSVQDAFAAVGEPGKENLFTEFELTETEEGGCPATLKKAKVRVEGSGTALVVKGATRKCGQLGEVGEIVSEKFRLAAAGETAVKGALDFTEKTEAQKKAELYNGSTGTFELISCTLTAGGAAEELGLSEINAGLEPAIGKGENFEKFGWEI